MLLSVTAAAGSASALPKPGELECALRVLAFNFSQTLLPEGGAVQDVISLFWQDQVQPRHAGVSSGRAFLLSKSQRISQRILNLGFSNNV